MKLAQKIVLYIGLTLVILVIINLIISHLLIDILLVLLGVLLILISFNKKFFEETKNEEILWPWFKG